MTSVSHGVMKTIALMSQKGGAGKTTLAVHLAVAAVDAGERVVVIDTDPQKSATVWSTSREAEAPIVATASVGDVDRVLAAAQGDDMTLAVIDTAPHAAPDAARIARASGLIVIPCRADSLRLGRGRGFGADRPGGEGEGSAGTVSLPATGAGGCRGSRRACDLRLARSPPVEITERRAFSRAIATGRAVTEFEADGKAAAEIRALWAWLQKEMP